MNAEQYCKAQGKELPTEQQWLAAAMGDSVRSYTWGDEFLETAAAQVRHSHFADLVNAGSMPRDFADGVSDMSGNGYKWINADMIRGDYVENSACIVLNSRICMGAAPLPLYQEIGIASESPATFRCARPAR